MEFRKVKELREGVTTGACAAAAKAAALSLVVGQPPGSVTVNGPTGREFTLDVLHLGPGRCGVVKDAGDDPDATDGMMIIADVVLRDAPSGITFAAGEGVGTVTLRGLKVAPGEAAINPGPRRMITASLCEVIGDLGAEVTISAPGGAERAKRTFNPRLGIAGGISILGTTGVVKPLNEQSIYDSLTLELETHSAEKRGLLAYTPGGAGERSLSAQSLWYNSARRGTDWKLSRVSFRRGSPPEDKEDIALRTPGETAESSRRFFQHA